MEVHVVTDGELGRDGGRDPRRRVPRPQVRQIVARELDACGLKRAANSYLCFRKRAGGQALLNIPEASRRHPHSLDNRARDHPNKPRAARTCAPKVARLAFTLR